MRFYDCMRSERYKRRHRNRASATQRVEEFLRAHDEFLDEFVDKFCDEQRVVKWLEKKKHYMETLTAQSHGKQRRAKSAADVHAELDIAEKFTLFPLTRTMLHKPTLLYELAKWMFFTINADSFQVYVASLDEKFLSFTALKDPSRPKISKSTCFKVEPGEYAAQYAAWKRTAVSISVARNGVASKPEPKFPKGVFNMKPEYGHALSYPITTSDNHLIATVTWINQLSHQLYSPVLDIIMPNTEKSHEGGIQQVNQQLLQCGQEATFNCESVFLANVSQLTWIHRDKVGMPNVLFIGRDSQQMHNNRYSISVTEPRLKAKFYSLTISRVQPSDDGDYLCKSANGAVFSTFKVLVNTSQCIDTRMRRDVEGRLVIVCIAVATDSVFSGNRSLGSMQIVAKTNTGRRQTYKLVPRLVNGTLMVGRLALPKAFTVNTFSSLECNIGGLNRSVKAEYTAKSSDVRLKSELCLLLVTTTTVILVYITIGAGWNDSYPG